jgi:hypothetical protein
MRVLGSVASKRTRKAISITHGTSPFISIYPFAGGFGTKYANPTVAPAGEGRDQAFDKAGRSVVVANITTPFIAGYQWFEGFSTKYANPATLPAGNSFGIDFNSLDSEVAIGHSSSPCVSVYKWSYASGFGTKYANPATVPTNNGADAEFNYNSTFIAVAHDQSPYISVYPWTVGTGFGTKLSNPGTLPGGEVKRIDFLGTTSTTNIGMALGTGVPANDGVAYPFTTSFGTRYALAVGLQFTGQGFRFTKSGTQCGFSTNNSPFQYGYPFTTGTGFGTKYANPASLPSGLGIGIDFDDTTAFVAGGGRASPYLEVWDWSGSGFGSKYSNPATLPTGGGNNPKWFPSY